MARFHRPAAGLGADYRLSRRPGRGVARGWRRWCSLPNSVRRDWKKPSRPSSAGSANTGPPRRWTTATVSRGYAPNRHRRPRSTSNNCGRWRPNGDVAAALEQAKVTQLPQTPDGKHVASDLMTFYFRSSEANDLCYRAHIGRDECRGLAGSEQEPR